MNIECVKTGCHAYLEEYGEYVYGDAHMLRGTLVLRVCVISRTPLLGVVHFRVGTIGGWFDKHQTSGKQNSTLLSCHFMDYGYEGKAI